MIELHNKSFLNVKIARRNPELGRKYKVPRTPSLVLVDADGEMLWNLYGYVPNAEYVAWLKTAAVLARHPEAVLGKSQISADVREVGDAFARASHDGRALEFFNKALELNEKKPASEETKKFKAETLARKGLSLYKNQENMEKIEGVSKALFDLDPEGKFGVRDNALFLRALVDVTQGRGVEAAAAVDEAMKKYPDSDARDGLLYIRGYTLLHLKGDRENARKAYQEILDRFPESPFRLGAEDALKSLK